MTVLCPCPEHTTQRGVIAPLGDTQITPAMREQVPANWKGDQAKESAVKNVLYRILEPDREATQRLFALVKNQPGYQ